MKVGTITTWIFVGFGLLLIGTLLYILGVNEKLARLLAAVGFVYFGIGMVLAVIHDRHMGKRTRAGQLRE